MYVVKTQKLCSYLMQQGFKLIKTDKNKYNEKYNIFLFMDTYKLREAITRFTELETVNKNNIKK